MNPPTTTSQTSKGPDLQLPGGPRPNIPQNDGCADSELTTKVRSSMLLIPFSLLTNVF